MQHQYILSAHSMPGMNTGAGERGMSKSDNSHKFLNLVREENKN